MSYDFPETVAWRRAKAVEWVEAHKAFDMTEVVDADDVPPEPEICDTVACIAGVIGLRVAALHPEIVALDGYTSLPDALITVAGAWLDLDDRQVNELFYASNAPVRLADISKKRAVRALRRLEADDRVVWA